MNAKELLKGHGQDFNQPPPLAFNILQCFSKAFLYNSQPKLEWHSSSYNYKQETEITILCYVNKTLVMFLN